MAKGFRLGRLLQMLRDMTTDYRAGLNCHSQVAVARIEYAVYGKMRQKWEATSETKLVNILNLAVPCASFLNQTAFDGFNICGA